MELANVFYKILATAYSTFVIIIFHVTEHKVAYAVDIA